jgi:hypothetical protein
MIHWRVGERETARQAMRDLESMLAKSGEVGSGTRASIQEARALTAPAA